MAVARGKGQKEGRKIITGRANGGMIPINQARLPLGSGAHLDLAANCRARPPHPGPLPLWGRAGRSPPPPPTGGGAGGEGAGQYALPIIGMTNTLIAQRSPCSKVSGPANSPIASARRG